MEKGEILEARIEDYTAEGQGVARVEGRVVFVPNAIAGELCRVRIEKVGKTWASGKMTELLERSPHRIDRDCPVAKLCGGCDFRHMDYVEECRLKSERVRQALNRIGGESLEEMPILARPHLRGLPEQGPVPGVCRKRAALLRIFPGRDPSGHRKSALPHPAGGNGPGEGHRGPPRQPVRGQRL